MHMIKITFLSVVCLSILLLGESWHLPFQQHLLSLFKHFSILSEKPPPSANTQQMKPFCGFSPFQNLKATHGIKKETGCPSKLYKNRKKVVYEMATRVLTYTIFHCFFLCHKFSDPSGFLFCFVFFWLIYLSAFSITMAKANILWKEEHFPSCTVPLGHRFITLTKLATWTETPIILRSARLEHALAKSS